MYNIITMYGGDQPQDRAIGSASASPFDHSTMWRDKTSSRSMACHIHHPLKESLLRGYVMQVPRHGIFITEITKN